MKNDITIKIAGEAGQGMQTIGLALCKIFKNAGYNIFANQDYMSRIRGGNNFFQIRVADEPIQALREAIDILVCLDKPSIALHENMLTDNGVIVLDSKKFKLDKELQKYYDIPFYQIADEVGGSEMFINAAASGVIAGLTGVNFSFVEETLKKIFVKKDQEVICKNIKVAQKAYKDAQDKFKKNFLDNAKPKNLQEEILINGNEAIALGAIHSGCKFYSAYPMTPATSIMVNLAKHADKFNIVVEQAEDEIAAINMAIGASFAGARAMTGSSGGGFALMQEGVSLAAMTETPVVIAEVQRPAPATGFPTRTEQSDLNFVLYSGHGELAKVVFTPGTIEECFYLTVKAFNLADKYQVPVFIVSDQHLADCIRNISKFDLKKVKCEKFIISKKDSSEISDYKRYKLTDNGVSPRAVPSWINDVIYADSDEHTEEGHITECAELRLKMTEKRLYKRMKLLEQEMEPPKSFYIDNADTVAIGFGSTFGTMKEAVEILAEKNIGYVHLSQVWPFPKQEILKLLQNKKKIITVENNATAQLAQLITKETAIAVQDSILKYDGRPFNLDELIKKLS